MALSLEVLQVHFCVFILGLSHIFGHKCVHDYEVAPYHAEVVRNAKARFVRPEDGTRRVVLETSPTPLRITPVYQLSGLPSEKVSFLKDRLIPAAIDVLQRLVKVRRPVQGNLLLPKQCASYYHSRDGSITRGHCRSVSVADQCGPYATRDPRFTESYLLCPFSPYRCVEHEGGPGAPGTDFLLYVTSRDMSSCSRGTVASGGFCELDEETARPIAGFANFCPNGLETDSAWGYQLDTAVHEILHGLVMSDQLFELFTGPGGLPYAGGPTIIGRNGATIMATPTVKRVVGEQFGCPSALGAALEDNGGMGTSISHWEARFFETELMQGSSKKGTRQLLSKLTLALIIDSGWYTASLEDGAILPFGYQKGCGFLTESCAEPVLPDMFRGHFCSRRELDASGDVCSWDHRAVSYCSETSRLLANCKGVVPYSNGACSDPANAQGASIDFGDSWGSPNSRCLPLASDELAVRHEATIFRMGSSGANCWDVGCSDPPSGRQRVMVTVRGKTVECPEGDYVDLTKLGVGIISGVIGPCPPPSQICPFVGCEEGCNHHGHCVGGECQCFLDWRGSSCGMAVSSALPKSAAPASEGLVDANSRETEAVSTAMPSPPSSDPPKTPEPSATGGGDTGNITLPVPDLDPSSQHPVDRSAGNSTSEALRARALSSSGYLQDCTVYFSVDGGPRESSERFVQTDQRGGFFVSGDNRVPFAVELPAGGACLASFTDLAPVVPMRAPAGRLVVSPLSTLVVELMEVDPGEQRAGAERRVASALGIDEGSSVFEKDLIHLIAEGGLQSRDVEEAAFTVLGSWEHAVAVASAWISGDDGVSLKRISAAKAVVSATARRISQQQHIDLADSMVVSGILEEAARAADGIGDSRPDHLGAVAMAISRVTLLARQINTEMSSLDFLVRMAALSLTVNTDVDRESALIGSLDLSAEAFANRTSDVRLQELTDSAETSIPNLAVGLEDPPSPQAEPEEKGLAAQIQEAWDYLLEHAWILYTLSCLTGAALLILVTSCICCCCQPASPEHKPVPEDQAVQVIDARRLAHALELSRQENPGAQPQQGGARAPAS